MHTSQHSALLEITDHGRCMKVFAVQPRKRPPKKKTTTDHREEDEADRRRAVMLDIPKNLIARHIQAGVTDAGVVSEVCSSNPPCA
jgi:hypothetical protein